MATFTYRQPVVGQALVDLIEGMHPTMTLDRFVGKYVAVCCFGSSRIGPGRAALEAMRRHKADFDDVKTVFLGIAIDPREKIDAAQSGIYYHLDADGALSRQCGAVPLDETVPFGTQYRVHLDPRRSGFAGAGAFSYRRGSGRIRSGFRAPEKSS